MSDGNFEAPGLRSIPGEPWVALSTGEELAGWGKEEEVAYNQRLRQVEKYAFYRWAMDFLYANDVRGDYFEFGCHRARTFRMALTEARRKNFDRMRFWAFDSFAGLPDFRESNLEHNRFYGRGALETSEEAFREIVRRHGVYADRVTTVKGFYHDSLTEERARGMAEKGVKASFVTVDCDLYESAVPVFAFLGPFLQEGTVLYLDDYYAAFKGSPFRGIGKAFREFEKGSPFFFEPFRTVGWWGRSYIACRPE